jgi:SulP family sulfate permease
VLSKWLPGLLFAVLLLVVIRRYEHFLLMPAMVLAAMGLFYLLVLFTNSSLAAIRIQGWVLGPFPQAGLWPPLTASALAHVHWSVLCGQIGHVGTMLVISGMAALLNTSGLEVTTRRPLEVNRELQAVGLGNLLAGLGGAPVGYHVLSDTALVHKMGVDSRGVGVCAAALCGAALFFGPSLLSYFPKPVLGGLLLFLGFTFLVEWVYEAWFKLTRIDYGLVLVILTVIATCGLLEGVAVGVGVAVVLFVAAYSRIGIVSQTLSGVTYQSTVERPLQQRRVLCEHGEQLYILKLQGYIFFGTANHVLQRVRQRSHAADLPSLRFVVLDFHRVSGLDASALHSFAALKEVAETQALTLVFTHLAPKLRQQLAERGYDQEDDQVFRIFPDLDHGVEWCENHLLDAAQGLPTEQQRTLQEQLRDMFPTAGQVERFMTYLDQQEVPAGFQLIRQGDPPQGLYFLDVGQLTAQLEGKAGERVRLRTMGAGTVVGELGLYLGWPASAAVVTDRPSTLYHLSIEAFTQLEQSDPEVATALHKFMVRLVGARLANNNKTLQALLD